MLEIFDLNYCALSQQESKEFFMLRKETFKDRLNWAVNCIDGMEFDQYDNHNANYLFGIKDNTVVCSVRFIETQYPNMITDTFFSYFDKIALPQGNFIESSRFFVDKVRAKALLGSQFPISTLLFLSMVNYARSAGYEGIFTIVSHPMLTILKRSGWKISVVEQGSSEKAERIYLLFLPVDRESQETLIGKVTRSCSLAPEALQRWPLSFSETTEPA